MLKFKPKGFDGIGASLGVLAQRYAAEGGLSALPTASDQPSGRT